MSNHLILIKALKEQKKKIKVRSRVIYFEDNGVFRGKDRTLALGAKFVLPPKNALKAIREAIENYGKEPAKPAKAAAKKAAPAKKAPAKKAAPQGLPNPANKPDNAADISDAVPQHTDGPQLEETSDDDLSLETAGAEA